MINVRNTGAALLLCGALSGCDLPKTKPPEKELNLITLGKSTREEILASVKARWDKELAVYFGKDCPFGKERDIMAEIAGIETFSSRERVTYNHSGYSCCRIALALEEGKYASFIIPCIGDLERPTGMTRGDKIRVTIRMPEITDLESLVRFANLPSDELVYRRLKLTLLQE